MIAKAACERDIGIGGGTSTPPPKVEQKVTPVAVQAAMSSVEKTVSSIPPLSDSRESTFLKTVSSLRSLRSRKSLDFNTPETKGSRSGVERGVTQETSFLELVSQVDTLSEDLAKTVSFCRKLKAENLKLCEQYTRLKTEHFRYRDRCLDLRKLLHDERSIKHKMECAHEKLVSKWRRELEQKAGELSDYDCSRRQVEASAHKKCLETEQRVQEEYEVVVNDLKDQVICYKRKVLQVQQSALAAKQVASLEQAKLEQEVTAQRKRQQLLSTQLQHLKHTAALAEVKGKGAVVELPSSYSAESYEQLRTKASELEYRIDTMKAEMTKVQQSAASELKQLLERLQEQEAEGVHLRSRLDQKTLEAVEKQTALASKNRLTARLLVESETLKKEVIEVTQEKAALSNQTELLKTELCREKENANQTRNRSALSSIEQEQTLGERIASLEADLHREKVESKERLSKLQGDQKKKLCSALSRCDTLEAENLLLQKQIAVLHSTLQETTITGETKLRDAGYQHQSDATALKVLSEEKSRWQLENVDLRKQLKRMIQKRHLQKKKTEKLSARCDELTESLNALHGTAASLEAKNVKASVEVELYAQQGTQLAHLKRKLSMFTSNKQRLRERFCKLRTDNMSLTTKVFSLQKRISAQQVFYQLKLKVLSKQSQRAQEQPRRLNAEQP